MFRFIEPEHLPSIAKITQLAKGFRDLPLQEGDATDDRLYIVADGSVGLYRKDPSGLSSPILGGPEHSADTPLWQWLCIMARHCAPYYRPLS
eukprot:351204-Amphidinium_carterae.1